MEHTHHHSSHHSKQEQNDYRKHQHQVPNKQTQDASGHDKHAGHHTEDFLKRFWICLILTIPVLLLSQMIQHWFGFRIAFASDKYVLLALGTAIYFYGGMPFLKGMVNEIKYNAIGMMTLVALAISVAFIYSAAV